MHDGKRYVVIRSDMVEVGTVRCWKEHITFSMLLTHDMRSSKFYSSYPNEVYAIDNIDPNSSVLEKF